MRIINKIFIISILILSSFIIIYGQSNDEIENGDKTLFPNDTFIEWHYEETYINASNIKAVYNRAFSLVYIKEINGKKIYNYFDSSRDTIVTTIDTTKKVNMLHKNGLWFRDYVKHTIEIGNKSFEETVINNETGFCFYDEVKDSFNLIFKYPCKVGDTYKESFRNKEVIEVNHKIIVKGVEYTTIVYRGTFRDDDTGAYQLWYLEPGTGIVKLDQYNKFIDGDVKLFLSMELIKTIKK